MDNFHFDATDIPKTDLLAAGLRNGTVVVFEQGPRDLLRVCRESEENRTEPAASKQRQVLYGHQGAVNCVLFSQCGRWLASAGADGTVHLARLETAHSQVGRKSGFKSRRAIFEHMHSLAGEQSHAS